MESIEDYTRKYIDKLVKYGLMIRFIENGQHRYKFTSKGEEFMKLSDPERRAQVRRMMHDE